MAADKVDGRAVSKAIARSVRPDLKSSGFTKFTARKAWRFADETIELIDFRSFTSYIAQQVGSTSFSFAVTVGVFYRCLDRTLDLPPTEWLTFRADLGKTVRQPWFKPMAKSQAHDRPDIWYVLADGANLVECVDDALHGLHRDGLPLLERLRHPEGAFHALLNETSTPTGFGRTGLSLPGRPDSPTWRDVTLAIGHLVVEDPRSHMRSAPVLEDA